MFGAALRSAIFFVGGMIFASVLKATLDPFVSIMESNLGSNHLLIQTFNTASQNFPLFVLMSGVMALIARAFVERKLGSGGRL
jgi:hypothetical protein